MRRKIFFTVGVLAVMALVLSVTAFAADSSVTMTDYGIITVLFEKPLLSVGLNLLLVIPGVLVANTPLWIAYPYCYSGYLVSCSLHDFTAETSDAAFSMFPFLPCAIVVFGLFFALAVTQFGKKEMR